MGSYEYNSLWLLLTYLCYSIAGICWIPVIYIQIKLRNLAKIAIAKQQELPKEYFMLSRTWFVLGWPAFASVIGIFFLMVFKPV